MTLEELITQAGKLMPAPQILPQLLNLLNDPDSDPFEIVELLRVDAPLTAQVLKLSNSAYYGMSSPSSCLEEAVNRVGFQEVYKMVAIICSAEFLGDDLKAYFIPPGKLWEHSLATATVMEMIAGDLDESETTAYTIGLLHSLGKTLINQQLSDQYPEIFDIVEQENIPLIAAESRVFGFNHATAAARLMESWKFPAAIREPIEYQYKPVSAPVEKSMSCMIHVSNWIAAGIGMSAGRDAFAFELLEEAPVHLGLAAIDFEKYMLRAHDKMSEVQKLLNVTKQEIKT